MQRENYLLMKNSACYSSGFDLGAYVNTTMPMLELIVQDPNGMGTEAVIEKVVNYDTITRSLPNLRYHIIQEHPWLSAEMAIMDRLVAEGKWTRVWYSRSWYSWGNIFKNYRPDTNIALYVKAYLPEYQQNHIHVMR